MRTESFGQLYREHHGRLIHGAFCSIYSIARAELDQQIQEPGASVVAQINQLMSITGVK
jgi:hypothetical protein